VDNRKIMAFIITIIFLSPATWLGWLIISNRDCYSVVGKILEIQELRDDARTEYRAKVLQFQNGTIDIEEYRRGYSIWIQEENELASSVAGLYSDARRDECL